MPSELVFAPCVEPPSRIEFITVTSCRYEQEIRRRTDELEKKMRDLDTLNRK